MTLWALGIYFVVVLLLVTGMLLVSYLLGQLVAIGRSRLGHDSTPYAIAIAIRNGNKGRSNAVVDDQTERDATAA